MISKLKDIDVHNIDKSIDEGFWTKKFCAYLQKRNQEDVNILKFAIRMEAFKRNEQKPAAKSKRLTLYKSIIEAHFQDGSESIGLSNGSLYDYLSEWDLNSNMISETDIEMLLKASTDPHVISEALDPSYKKFISQTSPSTLACLLSIL